MKIGPAVRPGRKMEENGKDKTGQDKTGQDSQKSHISPTLGRSPTAPIETKICVVGHPADIITCAKFQDNISGVTILQGSNFPFSY